MLETVAFAWKQWLWCEKISVTLENDFAYLQGEANTELERLHKLAEVDRNELCSEDGKAAATDVARSPLG